MRYPTLPHGNLRSKNLRNSSVFINPSVTKSGTLSVSKRGPTSTTTNLSTATIVSGTERRSSSAPRKNSQRNGRKLALQAEVWSSDGTVGSKIVPRRAGVSSAGRPGAASERIATDGRTGGLATRRRRGSLWRLVVGRHSTTELCVSGFRVSW